MAVGHNAAEKDLPISSLILDPASLEYMTWLDALCGVFLALVGLGGYHQGFVRGMLRLLALGLGGAIGMLLMLRIGSLGTPTTTIVWAVAAALAAIALSSAVSWSIAQSMPPGLHRSLVNRLLGVAPAVALGLLITTLCVALAERLAPTSATQAYIRAGALTGPLARVVDVLERQIIRAP